MDENVRMMLSFLGLGVFGLCVYFIPAWVAMGRKNSGAIFVLNLLLGWTVVGWVGALIWAMVAEKENFGRLPPPTYRLNERQREVFRD